MAETLDDRMRNSYMAFFGAFLVVLHLVRDVTTGLLLRCCLSLLLLPWPYLIFRRLKDLGLSGWWTVPYCAATILIIFLPLTFVPALVLVAALHSPLIFWKSGKLPR